MSPAEIVTLTDRVARSFGEDIAHEVCCLYLQRPEAMGHAERWWLRTARYCRSAHWRKDYSVDRNPARPALLAKRYWTEMKWAMRRPCASPEQAAACWELVDRIPADVALQLVWLEGLHEPGEELLRAHAFRYARMRPVPDHPVMSG